MKTILQVLSGGFGQGKAPEWFQVLPQGELNFENGKSAIIEEADARAIIAAFRASGHDMVVDYEHQTLGTGQAPAAGWIKELAWRGKDGLWARAEWTAAAAKMIAEGEYRYFSPVILVRKANRRVAGLYNVALTNQPLMQNLQALAAKHIGTWDVDTGQETDKQGDKTMLDKLKKLLGLAADAGEDAAVAAVTAIVAKAQKLEADLSTAGKVVAAKAVLDAVGAADTDAVETVVAKVEALKGPASAARDLATTVTALQSKLAGMAADGLVTEALKDGKVSPDEVSKWGRNLAVSNPEQFRLIVLSRPRGSVVPVDGLPPGGPPGPAGPDETALLVAKQMGVTPEDLKKYAAA